MRCFFKNKAFEHEKEYRIVLRIPENLLLSNETDGDIIEIGQFRRGNVLIPFIDYRFYPKSIKQVMVNPFVKEGDVFELGIKKVLWQNQMNDVRVVCSGIPMRKYN